MKLVFLSCLEAIRMWTQIATRPWDLMRSNFLFLLCIETKTWTSFLHVISFFRQDTDKPKGQWLTLWLMDFRVPYPIRHLFFILRTSTTQLSSLVFCCVFSINPRLSSKNILVPPVSKGALPLNIHLHNYFTYIFWLAQSPTWPMQKPQNYDANHPSHRQSAAPPHCVPRQWCWTRMLVLTVLSAPSHTSL